MQSSEVFSLDADGHKQDADLWAGLLGEEKAALRGAAAAMAKFRAEMVANRQPRPHRANPAAIAKDPPPSIDLGRD